MILNNKNRPIGFIILLVLTGTVLLGCGPTQEELSIGALQHFNRGNEHLRNNNPKAAVQEYTMAITLDDKQESFYYNLGLAYHSLVLYERAIDSYWKAIKYRPDFAEAWYNLSLSFDKVGETEKAFMAYDKYIKLNEKTVIKALDEKETQSKPQVRKP